VEAELHRLFMESVIALAESLKLHIALPQINEEDGKPFDPTKLTDENGKPIKMYLRAQLRNTDPNTHGVSDGEALHTWIGQISVYALNGMGEVKPKEIADTIGKAYPFVRQFKGNKYTFHVSKKANIASPVPTDGWFFIPVRIRLQTID